jgi:hypothetical protein
VEWRETTHLTLKPLERPGKENVLAYEESAYGNVTDDPCPIHLLEGSVSGRSPILLGYLPIVAGLIILGLTSALLVDWAWFAASVMCRSSGRSPYGIRRAPRVSAAACW